MSTLFRKVAVERLSSPEQLDQLTHVTGSRSWIALASIGLLLVMAVIWSSLGRLPERVSGTGMLLKSGGVLEVVSPSAGRIADVGVAVGDVVREGQVVARVEQPDLLDQLAQARTVLANARADFRQLTGFSQRDAQLQTRFLREQRQTVEQGIVADDRAIGWLTEKIAAQELLVKQGLLTRTSLASSQQQLDGAREHIQRSRGDLVQIDAKMLSMTNNKADELRTSQERLTQAEHQEQDLARQLHERSQVVSPFSGRILELIAEDGRMIGRGEALMTLDMMGRAVSGLEAIIYVPATSGKQIKLGMPIQIAPSTVKQEEFGLMLGRVTYVSDFPATPRGMNRVLKNDQLVSVLANGRATYEVHADLIVDPRTTSQYRWSSSSGPPVQIKSGTLAVGNIEIASRRPIAMVIPLLKQYFGL